MPSPKLHIEPMTREKIVALLGCWGYAPETVDLAETAMGKLRRALDSQPEQEIDTPDEDGVTGIDRAVVADMSQQQKQCGGSGTPSSSCEHGFLREDCAVPGCQPQKPGERETADLDDICADIITVLEPNPIEPRTEYECAFAGCEAKSPAHYCKPREDAKRRLLAFARSDSPPASHQSPLLRVAEELEEKAEAIRRSPYPEPDPLTADEEGRIRAHREDAQRLREEAEGLGEEGRDA